MRSGKYNHGQLLSLLAMLIAFNSFGFIKNDQRGQKKSDNVHSLNKSLVSGKNGDAYRFNINNINLPLNNKGKIAAVNIPPDGSDAKFGGKDFLFSSGFFVSGYTNGKLWSFANASSSLIENTVAGTVASPNDPKAQIYVLNKEDVPFGDSWQQWKDAVALGADFYDGDRDGQYDPTDKNGNGEWDPDEDRPDLMGDETAWCVYNDGQPGSQRTYFKGIEPQGVEIRQTIFGFASNSTLGNILFVRYRFKNTGLKADTLKDVYFGVWADPDIGGTDGYQDDLVGVDVSRDAGYVYNDGADASYGPNPPCFMIDFFSGPISYIPNVTFEDIDSNGVFNENIDIPIDTAFSVRGQVKGVKIFPGATNLGISSFVHYQQSDPTLGDPQTEIEARNYMLGLDKLGKTVDPCNWPLSDVEGGVDCKTIDKKFWYSGDPVTHTGWINNRPTDQRMMQNTGPFKLIKNEELEVVVAYVIGQGTDALSSITEARKIDDGAQFIFSQNFAAPSPPPSVKPAVTTGDGFIDLVWDTDKQVNYKNRTPAWNLNFEGYNVYEFKTNSFFATVNDHENRKVVARYDLADSIRSVYKENPETGGIELLYPVSSNQLDPSIYSQPANGKIRLRLTTDAFTGQPFIKGKPYYFAVTSYALNYSALLFKNNPDTVFGAKGDYYLTATALSQESENNLHSSMFTVVMSSDLYDPAIPLKDALKVSGGASGKMQIDVVDKSSLSGDEYKVTFKIDSSSAEYSTYWQLEDVTKGIILVDSSKTFSGGKNTISGIPSDGFIVRLTPESPQLGSLIEETSTNWYNPDKTMVLPVGSDLSFAQDVEGLPGLAALRSTYVKADKLRRVEIRFGEYGKAYRYLNGYIGSTISRRSSYPYAQAVTASDTIGKGAVGKLGEGFVDVPFTAWVQDFSTESGGYGETRQLEVGFIEKASNIGGNPDGNWNPGTDIKTSGEYILIFNSTYDPNGGNKILKGGYHDGQNTIWADLRGGNNYNIPKNANVSKEDLKIAASPYFNTLYVLAVQKKDALSNFISGDKFVVPVETYPYTPNDVFTFQTSSGGKLSSEEEKSIFETVNVFPNPLYGFNKATSYTNSSPDEPFVTFSNLPEEITIKIYTLSGTLIRTLTSANKSSVSSPFLQWNLQNESGLRVASGLYIAIVSSPKYGDKILKFSVILPQKQIQKF